MAASVRTVGRWIKSFSGDPRVGLVKALALAAGLSLSLIGCSDEQGSSGKQAKGNPAAGKAIAERDCKGCHGLDGKGTAVAIPNLGGQSERYLVASLTEYREGKRSHAALREVATHMSDTDARNVAAYYASLPPVANDAPKEAVASPYESGKKAAAACAGCHGEDGNSKTAGIPSLAGQQPRYFVTAVQEYLTGAREAAPMHAMVRDLSRIDLENVALYFASQTPAERSAPPTGDVAAAEPLTALCGGCHGARGVSIDAATPSLAGQDPQYLVKAMEAYRTTRRHPAMERAVARLSDKDIENIAAFYAVQKSRPAANGVTLIHDLTEKCNHCHGANVDNPTLAIPKLAGQDKDYLIMALREYRDERRESSVMHKMSMPYSDSVIESIAAFYADQPPK
jgi:cytochrome c553